MYAYIHPYMQIYIHAYTLSVVSSPFNEIVIAGIVGIVWVSTPAGLSTLYDAGLHHVFKVLL